MPKEPRAKRGIRMNDAEWQTFCDLLGPEWLRGQIAKAQERANRKPVPAKDQAE